MKNFKQNMTIHSELIEQCRRGNSKAQFELYSLYSKAMYNVSRRILPDSMEAEDAMQEAFFKAFVKIDSFRNNVTFGAWLKRIVVNTCIDHLKKRKNIFINIDETYDIAVSQVEDDYLAPTSVEAVKLAMNQLADGYRLVLNLRLIDGYEYPEIAEMIGTTQSNVRSQFTRAKQKLIDILKQNGVSKAIV